MYQGFEANFRWKTLWESREEGWGFPTCEKILEITIMRVAFSHMWEFSEIDNKALRLCRAFFK